MSSLNFIHELLFTRFTSVIAICIYSQLLANNCFKSLSFDILTWLFDVFILFWSISISCLSKSGLIIAALTNFNWSKRNCFFKASVSIGPFVNLIQLVTSSTSSPADAVMSIIWDKMSMNVWCKRRLNAVPYYYTITLLTCKIYTIAVFRV